MLNILTVTESRGQDKDTGMLLAEVLRLRYGFKCMNRQESHVWCAAVAAAILCAGAGQASGQEQELRYHARLGDNTMVVGEPIRDWHDVNATPRIGNFPIFDPNRTVDWLVRDTPNRKPAPAAYIELVGGDRIPGEVVGYSSGDESPYRVVPPHLTLRPALAMGRPNAEFDVPLRILSQSVRRVVWQAMPGEPTLPQTAVEKGGRRLSFRALRWTPEGVSLLLESGVEVIPYRDLAEVHLGSDDPWAAFFDNAATVLGSGEGRLVQIETDDGLVAMTSTLRLRPETHGDNRKPDHWYQAIQPAWSLDTLWVRFSSVLAWRLFSPERVPVTLLDPKVSREGVVFSASRRPLINAAVTGEPLGDGLVLFGWGFGSHAPCRFQIALPAGAVALRGGYSLDPSVGSGGCAKARFELLADGAPQTLFESEVLVGAGPARGVGRLEFPKTSSGTVSREVALIADPVYEGGPAGSDPFDIRDAVNWLAPEVELDKNFVQNELRRRAFSRLPGLAGWNVDPVSADQAAVSVRWDTRDWEEPRFRSYAAVESSFVKLSRRLRIDEKHRYLAVFAHCPHDDFRPARIQVRIDGVVVGEASVPTEHGRREPDPLLFPVTDYAGRSVTVEVVQLPGAIGEAKPAAVDWRSVALVTHRPGLLPLFEDDATFAETLTEGSGTAGVDALERQTGEASLQVTPAGRSAASIPNWDFIVTEEPDFGEFRHVRFAWKAEGEGPIAWAVGHDGQFGPGDGTAVMPRRPRRRSNPSYERGLRNGYRYSAGSGEKNGDSDFLPSVKLDGRAPQEWRTVQRDLFGDFGAFTFTGAGFFTKSGSVRIDGLYLARSPDQFRFVEDDLADVAKPAPGEGNLLLKANDARAFPAIVAAVAPAFSLSGQGGELQLLKEYRGRSNVLRTQPEGGEERQSARLTAAVTLPKDAKSRLRFSVSQQGENENDQQDWDLQILANGRELLNRRVDRGATNGLWLDVETDLTEFAGQPLRLELRNRSNGGGDVAYWHDLRMTSEPL